MLTAPLDVYKEGRFIKTSSLSFEPRNEIVDLRADWPYNAQLYVGESKPTLSIDWSRLPVRVYVRSTCKELLGWPYLVMNMTQRVPILQCVMCPRDSVFAEVTYLETFCSHECCRKFIRGIREQGVLSENKSVFSGYL